MIRGQETEIQHKNDYFFKEVSNKWKRSNSDVITRYVPELKKTLCKTKEWSIDDLILLKKDKPSDLSQRKKLKFQE